MWEALANYVTAQQYQATQSHMCMKNAEMCVLHVCVVCLIVMILNFVFFN